MIDQLGENFQLLLVEGLDGIGTGRERNGSKKGKGKRKTHHSQAALFSEMLRK